MAFKYSMQLAITMMIMMTCFIPIVDKLHTVSNKIAFDGRQTIRERDKQTRFFCSANRFATPDSPLQVRTRVCHSGICLDLAGILGGRMASA